MTERPGEFESFCVDQLRDLGAVEPRRMFGGAGLYHDGVFFAIVHRARLYLKTDDATRRLYEERGMGPFRPSARQTLGSYFEVPPEVLEHPAELSRWARAAVDVQKRAAAAVRPSRKRRSRR